MPEDNFGRQGRQLTRKRPGDNVRLWIVSESEIASEYGPYYIIKQLRCAVLPRNPPDILS
jgi:hypothetical protein